MEKMVPRPIGPSKIFVESLTCYRGWAGYVVGSVSTHPNPYSTYTWSFQVIRQPDWLSPSLRAKLGKLFELVEIQTPSGALVGLMGAVVSAFGAAVWRDPIHSKPGGPLEMVTYMCGGVQVNNTGVSPAYNWWKLNA